MSGEAGRLAAQRFAGLAGLRSVLEPWRRVFEAARLDPLCNDPDWCLAHAECFAPDETVFGWSWTDAAGEPVAVLPFRTEPSRGAFALRRAIHVADGTFDSDYLDLCIRPGWEEAVVADALERLAGERRLEAVVLAGVPEGSPALAAVHAALDARRLPRRERPSICLAAPLPEDFDAYLAGLRPRVRSKVRQALRRADEAGASLAWCREASALEGWLAELFELHARRWEAAGEAGAFADPRRRELYLRLARVHLERGNLRLARLERDGRPLALQLGFVLAGTYYQIQEGHDPEAEELRAGVALRALAIRGLIEEGVRSYDFLAGDGRHKREWGATDRPCRTLAFALPRWRGRLAYGARALADALGRKAE